ncbi:hypothetical protein MCRY_19245 [Marivita cryptomonadis]|uniref:beta strand repeat-containing protein n=1 Tax=Marivita cryptomonadis TaxID=505252 RepID=UPI000A1FD9B4|nr:S-layer family protein [Marivita cryptomonadis]OSQ56750.1 hypothetical protein MCRY_19245 [Marivita cryptomonadis]
MKFTPNLRNSTATAALLITFGASGALAQATADTNMGASETIVTSATFTAGNVQELTATPSATTANNNVNISLTVSDGIDDVVTVATPATNNLTTASATGNSSTAAAELLFSPSTAGDTAAVGTLQSVEADVIALSSSDTHSIVIENDGAGIRTLTGTSLSDNNDITAAATGNSAKSTITAASGLDLVQATAGQASLDIDSSLAAAADNDVAGDLIVSSSQEIDGNRALGATVSGAVTRTRVEGLDTATVTVSNSDQASTSIGNSATSSISSLDTTASITASTAVSNLQTIVPSTVSPVTTISAATTGSTIEIQSGVDSNGNATGDVTNTTISVAGNDQTAGATGSVSTQSITLDASSITGEGAAAVISDADTAADGKTQLSAAGDSIIGNVQTIDSGVTVSGTVSGNNISSVVADLDDNTVTTSTLEVTGNRQAASATGVSTSNALSLTSGATMSAAGAVGSVQEVDGSVTAATTSNSITNAINTDDDLDDSSMRTTANAVTSAATGATATNSLSTTSATNNLSVALNAGTVQNSVAAGSADQYSVTAGQALTNDQSMASTAVVSAETTANQILTQAGTDVTDSTVATDDNRMSASATANSADNGILLSFNNLVGTASGAGTGVIAATANEQTLADSATVTARVVGTGGVPILTTVDSDVQRSSVSTSGNTVSASASGNVTSGNNVVVDATNITSGSEAAPSIVAATGAQTTTGSFVAASTQLSGADILASQRDSAATPTTSNTIRTNVDNDIQLSSTVVSDDNVLSAVATANSANNAVQLGDANTATVAASGTVANYQATAAAGSVTAEIGITGSDPISAFSSLNSAPAVSGTIGNDGTLASGGAGYTNNGATPIVFTFATPLTSEEQAALLMAGFSNISGNNAEIAPGAQIDTFGGTAAQIISVTYSTASGTTLAFANFAGTASPGVVNGAGVIVSVDADAGSAGEISASTVSVSGNTAVGEVTGNVATNATSATATTVTGLSGTATSINAADFDVAPATADLATASLQDSASALSSDVAATFAILDGQGEIDAVTDSTQIVSDNLQQSYATANRATNSVDLTATNTDADTALENAQRSTATVSTTSDLDVVANAGGTTSSLAMEGNVNQSVANGNVATNTTTVDVTNATATGTVDASIALGTLTADANNALASVQSVSANVTASATTDVYNQDVTRTGGNEIISSDVSLSSNSTIAQATGNNGTQTLTLGDAGTANMDRTGVLVNNQDVTSAATVSSTVNQDVEVTLSNTGTIPIQSSSVALDGNQTTALARSNVASNTLTVDGNSIDAGVGTDASFTAGGTTNAAYVLGSDQDNDAVVTAMTSQSRVEVDVSDTGAGPTVGGGVLNSTVSLAGNVSSTTALANSVVNSVSVGANASNVDAAAELASIQGNSGAVTSTGGSAVVVDVDVTGGTAPIGINGSSVMLSENVSASSATGNQAENSLTTAGANIVSGASGTNATADSSGTLTASGGNLVANNQNNTGAINSTNTANTVTISSDTVDGTTPGNGAAASGSTLGVTGNVTEARASANLATNSSITIGGAGTASLDSTALVMNSQTNTSTGTVDASASTNTTVSLSGTTDATALDTGTAMVEGNSTLALARGNVAGNTVVANGANATGGGSPAGVNSTAGVLGGVLNASFGVFNEQSQAAAISATSTGASYRVNATSGTRTAGNLGLALNASSASVSGNAINASALGNVATNSVTLASLSTTANDASAAAFNTQSNSGDITSQATGATIGTFSIGGIVSASVGVSNNSISASSIGNFATSTVTRTDR